MTDPTPFSERRGVLMMLASVLFFAGNTLLVRGVSQWDHAADGWVASLFRGAVGLIVVVSIFGFGRGLHPSRLIGNRLVMLRGVLGSFGIAAFYITVVKLGAARGVILNLTYPIFGTIIAAVWLKEKIRASAVLWMAVGFVGLCVFLGGKGQAGGPSGYDFLGLAGALAAGCVIVIIRRLRASEHPATIFASQCFYGLLVSLPAAWKVPALSRPAWWWLALAAVFVAGAQLIMTRAYQALSVSRGSAVQMILPLVTAAGSFVIFGERFTSWEIGGAMLTLAATWRVVAAR